jgi:large subunit ribosomal protein L10
MTRQEKNQFIDSLDETLSNSSNFYLADISGLSVSDSNDLRRSCFNTGVQLQVVKNTLLKKAMEKAEGSFDESYEILKGNTALFFSNTGNAPAKLIKDFRKKHEKPILKGAFVEESFYIGDEQLSTLATIKSKNELIGDIIGLLQSPAKNIISGLKASGGKLSGILKALEENPVQSKASGDNKGEVEEVKAEAMEEVKEEVSGATPAAESNTDGEGKTEESDETETSGNDAEADSEQESK